MNSLVKLDYENGKGLPTGHHLHCQQQLGKSGSMQEALVLGKSMQWGLYGVVNNSS